MGLSITIPSESRIFTAYVCPRCGLCHYRYVDIGRAAAVSDANALRGDFPEGIIRYLSLDKNFEEWVDSEIERLQKERIREHLRRR